MRLRYIYLSMLAHAYNIIIDRGSVEPGHGRDDVDGLNANKKNSFNVNDNCSTSWCISL